MHDLMRLENRGGSENISGLNLSKASFMWPLEQRLVNSLLTLDAILEVTVQKKYLARV